MLETLRGWCVSIVSFLRTLFKSKLKFETTGMLICKEDTLLGEGAFSNVYRAVNVSNFEHYALKKILLQSREIEQSAKMEIESFRMFKHKNIVECLDYKYESGSNSNAVYLVFPLIAKGSLRNKLNAILDNRIAVPELEDLLKDFYAILEAFNVLHSHSPSFIHRDIKPENILLGPDDRPLLTDFGSVTTADVTITTRAEALAVADEAAQFCTMPYRPPEMFDPTTGTRLDARTDVWGIGCLFFAWRFGYSPFECEYNRSGSLQVTECTYLRVLGNIPQPPNPTLRDRQLLDLVK